MCKGDIGDGVRLSAPEAELTGEQIEGLAQGSDFDGDGFPNAADNCPSVPNFGQEDSDGIGEACEEGGALAYQLPGDSSQDGAVDLSDAVRVFSYLFLGAAPPVLGTSCVPLTGCAIVLSDRLGDTGLAVRGEGGSNGESTACIKGGSDFLSLGRTR